ALHTRNALRCRILAVREHKHDVSLVRPHQATTSIDLCNSGPNCGGQCGAGAWIDSINRLEEGLAIVAVKRHKRSGIKRDEPEAVIRRDRCDPLTESSLRLRN